MGPDPLVIVTRSSRLARGQTEEARDALGALFPERKTSVLSLQSPGDRDQTTPLSESSVPDDFFTRDLDDALLDGTAHVAVHSAKDLPAVLRDGLVLAALLPARDIRDALVARKDWKPGQPIRTIGTSSPKRAEEIRKLYPTVEIKPLRGPVDQRLIQLDAGKFDAIIVAACALERLGLADRITEYLPYDPVPQQGRLAIVTRSDAPVSLRVALRRSLDVRHRAGLVALVDCPLDPAQLSARARGYLEQADIVFHDRPASDAVLKFIRGNAVHLDASPQSEIHRHLLQAAEQGQFVVYLQSANSRSSGQLEEVFRFLMAWNIRADHIPATMGDPLETETVDAGSHTLFVGTDPDRFLRHGPLTHWPMIRLIPHPMADRLTLLDRYGSDCEGVLFPSRFAVETFMTTLAERNDIQWFAGKKVISIGPATTDALSAFGVEPDFSIDSYSGLEELVPRLPDGLSGRILYPCSDAAPVAERVALLATRGVELCPLPFYRNEAIPYRSLPTQPFQRVLFTSGSTVEAYFSQYPDERTAPREWLALGPSTGTALKAIGLDAERIPSPRLP